MRINRNILVVVVVIVVAAVGLLLFTQNSTPVAAVQAISPSEYQAQFANTDTTYSLFDVRTPEEYNSGHIAGAVNIPVEVLQSRLSEVPRDRPIIVYCHSGNRSTQAANILADAGYTNIRNLGGINAWVDQGYPIE